ncbi:MAG: hypothetical protein KBA18_10685 [Kiritimatiellae bacterium]|nr:hypothetical protein [Alphaproteobacteria bacterium]MBP7638331.1 hypothetical protein [Kiritimatiellia bacterium]
MKHKDQALATLLSHDAPCDRYSCPARSRCAAELLACHALLIYVETGFAHDPRDFAPPTLGVFDSIERPKAMSDRGANYKLLRLPADKSAWAWAEFMGAACPQP